MYLIARGIDKERFISATGFLFLVGALPLALGYILAVFCTTNITTIRLWTRDCFIWLSHGRDPSRTRDASLV